METNIRETCGECYFFVDRGNFSCCHYNPPQFQLTSAFQEEDTGRRSWWTYPFVKEDEIACGCFMDAQDVIGA